jgi:AraC family transcriptional regulator of adaptative response / DNA-3-methyladenine glycosylase II
MTKEDSYYQAMLARDHRFDGKFFVGVRTTGIYCRPICPAKPKRENVEFYPNAAAAEKAGYRPCLRCRPESAPMSPAWIGKSAIVNRAVKTLHDLDTLEFDEDRFAARFGVSARHLRRVFINEIGKTPKQIAFENRLNLARQLITETSLPVTRIAFAAGFRSVRRFNGAFKERFKKSPSRIRRAKTAKDGAMILHLSYRPPYDFESLLKIYRSHAVGDLERIEDDRYVRILHLNGKSGTVTVENDPAQARLKVAIDCPDASAAGAIVARVRAMFDLDSDPLVIANVLESDPLIRKMLRNNPGIRMASGWDPFETAIGAILGQLVSVDFGRALVADLIRIAGYDGIFPSPRQIASSDLAGLRTTGKRKRTLIEFSKAVAEHKISLEPAQDPDEFIRSVRAIPGIGPWTADYMALRVLRHADAFPATDLILARALEKHPHIEKMSPWRGYLAALFWREYSQSLKKGRKK